MGRRTNAAGVTLVKEFESFEAEAYTCPAGKLTIGYGHVILPDEGHLKSKKLSEAEADELLKLDLSIAEAAVEKYITVPLTGNQFAALSSFTFNLGTGNLRNSTLRRKLNEGDYNSVARQLDRWVYAGGKRLRGLARRRTAEGKLFNTPTKARECYCPCHD